MMIGHSPRSVPTEPRRSAARGAVATWVMAGAMLAPAVPAGATPEAQTAVTKTYYERSVVVAADARCRLFTPPVTAALKASTLQARGAAVRAGANEESLIEAAAKAEAIADRTSCGDADLATIRERVSQAFSGWTRLRRMEFPGGRAAWKADRTAFDAPAWRLVQTGATGGALVDFGLIAGEGPVDEIAAVVSFPGKSRPYAVRILMRDADRLPRPWSMGEAAPGLPPETGRQAFYAGGSRAAAASLLAEDRKQGEVWTFGPEAIERLAALDPREPFVIEFLFRDDSVARARFEVGDLAAGRAFTAMGSL